MHKSVRHGDGALQYTILPQDSEEGDWGAAGGGPKKKKKCSPRTVITIILFLFVLIGIFMAVIVPMYLNGSESENGNVGPAPFGDLGQAEGGNQNIQGNVMVISPPDTDFVTTISSKESGTEISELEGKTPVSSKDNNFRVENKGKVVTLLPEQKTTTEKYNGTKSETSTEATTQVTPKTKSNTVIKLDIISTTEHHTVTNATQTPSSSTQEYKGELQDLFKDEDKQKVETADQKKVNKTLEESTTETNTPTTEIDGKGSGTTESSTKDEVNMENFTRSPVKGHDSDKVKVTETNEEKNKDDYVTPTKEEGGFFSSVKLGIKNFDYQDYIAIAVVGSFTILLLIITGACFVIHRRKKTRRRKAVGKMVTDLQSGDNVMLLTGSSEEE